MVRVWLFIRALLACRGVVEAGVVSRCRRHGNAAPGRRIPTPAVSVAAPAPRRTSDTRCEKAQPPWMYGDYASSYLWKTFSKYVFEEKMSIYKRLYTISQ